MSRRAPSPCVLAAQPQQVAPRGLWGCPLRDPRSPWHAEEGDTVPMCRVMCPMTFPLPREVTRRLLSQCPPLKSSFPSGDTANVREHRSAPGAKGPCRKRWVLVGGGQHGMEAGTRSWHRRDRESSRGPEGFGDGDSLGVGDGGVFGEAEVVGDVLVVGQPVVGPQQAVGTHGDLGRGGVTAVMCLGDPQHCHPRVRSTRASVSLRSPGRREIPE